jgi:uncharacterized membrane protein YsdA (DUF1294 family)
MPFAFSLTTLAVLSVYALGSLVTFVAFGIDKRRATRNERRIPERTLHGLELAFGWPGALAGMLVFRHKTRKARYLVVTALVVLVHLALFGAALTFARSHQ